MSKVPLSTDGIAQLQTDLYALSDPLLFAQADAVRLDFVGWVDDHIVLTAVQLNFLNEIDQLYIDYLATSTAIAFRARRPLNITLPNPVVASARGDDGKWFLDKSTINPKWRGPEVYEVTGEISFELGHG